MKKNTFKKGFKPHYELIWNTWEREKPFLDYVFIVKINPRCETVNKKGRIILKTKHGMNFKQRPTLLSGLGEIGFNILIAELGR